MNKNQSGKYKLGLGGVAILVVVFILLIKVLPAIFKVLGWIIIALLTLAAVFFVVLIVSSFRQGSKDGGERKVVDTSINKTKVPLTPEQHAAISKGRSTLTEIRMLNARIKNAEIGRMSNETCAQIDKILQALKEKPEKIVPSRQLINYYVPTIKEVLSKFQRLEASGIPVGDMPEKVKSFLADVQAALGNQYEGLYDNDKLHMEVDMEALSIALRRDGLIDDSFSGDDLL